jgi:hypothetical protein
LSKIFKDIFSNSTDVKLVIKNKWSWSPDVFARNGPSRNPSLLAGHISTQKRDLNLPHRFLVANKLE